MKVRRNNKLFKKTRRTVYNYFVGDMPGELKRLRGFYARAIRNNAIPTNVDIHVARQICCPIPSDQARQVAKARGEKLERTYTNTEFKVLFI